ncbi:sensor histidine kinase [Streptomyces sp. NPDC048484]|uniref:sensor histidine kinase n=1 Tax=Streptomyces sp. NPDC048484 TaxID=3155146 RepID=UPI00341462A1
MERADVPRRRWAVNRQRIGRLPTRHVVAVALLASLAMAELAVRLLPGSASTVPAATSGSSGGDATVQLVLGLLALLLLCLSATLPVLLTRPVPAVVVVTVANVVSFTLLEAVTLAGLLAQLICAYRLGRAGPELLAVAVDLPFLVLALAGPAATGFRVHAVALAALVPVAALAGTARRARHEAQENSANRRAIEGTLLEHTARGERARIARELHDVVAHHISMISVQAETARMATPGMPAEGAKRLLGIGDTARAALTEMRRLLGVLREDTSRDSGTRHPQPGLEQLNELIDEARDASGGVMRFIMRGSPEALDPGVELAAYRIVQEALTNARRHAPGAAVDVELHFTDDILWLRVRDNGPGGAPATPSGGHGLLGMRERAASVGGSVRTGQAAAGGFLVEASLPAKTEGP